jgi:hypothetical protein
MFAAILVCHVLAGIGVGPIFTLPFLASVPAALRTVLILLRFGAGATLLSGIWLWFVLKPVHPIWLYVSFVLFLLVVATITVVLAPAAKVVSEKPEMRRRIRLAGVISSALTLCIAALMMLRPSWA